MTDQGDAIEPPGRQREQGGGRTRARGLWSLPSPSAGYPGSNLSLQMLPGPLPPCHLLEHQPHINAEAAASAVSLDFSSASPSTGPAPSPSSSRQGQQPLAGLCCHSPHLIRSAPIARLALLNTTQITALSFPTSPQLLGTQQAPAQSSPCS